MKVLKATPRFSDGERIPFVPVKIELEDGEDLEIFDEFGNPILSMHIGVKSQEPSRMIVLSASAERTFGDIWFFGGQHLTVSAKKKKTVAPRKEKS